MAIDLTVLVGWCSQLDKGVELPYINPNNTSRITIHAVPLPYGPIVFSRRKKGQRATTPKLETISIRTLRLLASKIEPQTAFTIDVLRNGGGNNRSVIEAIFARLPEFFTCRPATCLDGVTENVKHLYWDPDRKHKLGEVVETDSIRGIMSNPRFKTEATTPKQQTLTHTASNFLKLRRHEQIQVLLFEIGAALGYRNWIAGNDRSIKLNGKPLIKDIASINDLSLVNILQPFPAAQKAARLIDLIYFKPDGYIPAVFEIESTTTISSGLARMEEFRLNLNGVFRNRGSLGTCFVIVANEDRRAEVLRKAAAPQYKDLAVRFMSYGEVEELWRFCQLGRGIALNDRAIEAFSLDCSRLA